MPRRDQACEGRKVWEEHMPERKWEQRIEGEVEAVGDQSQGNFQSNWVTLGPVKAESELVPRNYTQNCRHLCIPPRETQFRQSGAHSHSLDQKEAGST